MVNDIRFLSIHADCKMVSTVGVAVGVTVVPFFHDKISFCIGLHNGSFSHWLLASFNRLFQSHEVIKDGTFTFLRSGCNN